MSTPSQIASQARRRRRLVIAAAVVLLVPVVVYAGWLLWPAGDGGEQPPVQEPGQQASAPPGTFGLLPGEDTHLDRFPVKLPQTPQGAVSAVLYELHALSTTDSAVLAQGLETYHAGEYVGAGAASVEAGLQRERAYELLTSKPQGTDFDSEAYPQPGAYYSIAPLGVWWEVVDDSTVEVLVLTDKAVSDGAGLGWQTRFVYGRTMVWDPALRGGDWRVEAVTDPTREPFFQPDPEEYRLDHESWTPIHHPEEGHG